MTREFKQFLDDDAIDIGDLRWRSYGKDGRGPPVVHRLVELSTDHLRAIVENCPGISPMMDAAIRTMLEMPPRAATASAPDPA